MNTHNLLVNGNGEHVWGECTCEQPGRGRMWAWTGDYAISRKGNSRLVRLRAAFVAHVAFELANPGYWA